MQYVVVQKLHGNSNPVVRIFFVFNTKGKETKPGCTRIGTLITGAKKERQVGSDDDGGGGR